MSTTAIRPTTIKIDPSIKDRVKRLADSRHRTPHRIMIDAISEYVEREEKREAFRQDGIRAWNEYQATGLHITFEEAGRLACQAGSGARRRAACMPRLIWAPSALDDVRRAYRFLFDKNPAAAM